MGVVDQSNNNNNNEPSTYESGFVDLQQEVLQRFVTQHGNNLWDLQKDNQVMIVFLRSFICPFCAKACKDVEKVHTGLRKLQTMVVFIHPHEVEEAECYFGQFEPIVSNAPRIADPQCELAGHFGVKMGTLSQLMHPKIMPSLVRAGREAKDYRFGFSEVKNRKVGKQLGSVFVVRAGQILSEYRHHYQSDLPDYLALLPEFAIIMGNNAEPVRTDAPKIKMRQQATQSVSPIDASRLPTLPTTKQAIETIESDETQKKEKKKAEKQSVSCFAFVSAPKPKPRPRDSVTSTSSGISCSSSTAPLGPITLNSVLAHPSQYHYFKLFATKEFSVENCLFLEDAKKFVESDDSTRETIAESMVEQYLSESSPNMLNLDKVQLDTLVGRVRIEKYFGVDLFESTETAVCILLEDVFYRFQESELFAKMPKN